MSIRRGPVVSTMVRSVRPGPCDQALYSSALLERIPRSSKQRWGVRAAHVATREERRRRSDALGCAQACSVGANARSRGRGNGEGAALLGTSYTLNCFQLNLAAGGAVCSCPASGRHAACCAGPISTGPPGASWCPAPRWRQGGVTSSEQGGACQNSGASHGACTRERTSARTWSRAGRRGAHAVPLVSHTWHARGWGGKRQAQGDLRVKRHGRPRGERARR